MAEVDIKRIADNWRAELLERINSLKIKGIIPQVTIISDTDMSNGKDKYVNNKKKRCLDLGIEFNHIKLDLQNLNKQEQLELLAFHLKDIDMGGVMVQLPFGDLKEGDISHLIPSVLDVDGFTKEQKIKLIEGEDDALIPATALGVLKIIEDKYGKDLTGKQVCIVNRSNLIGKPLFHLLLQRNATITMCHSKTNRIDLTYAFLESDIIVTGCGKRNIFNSYDLGYKNELIIDCSMTKVEGISNVGDWNKESVLESNRDVDIASGYGATGVLTVLGLCENIIKSYENIIDK